MAKEPSMKDALVICLTLALIRGTAPGGDEVAVAPNTAQAWALCAAAMLTEINHGRHDVLAAGERTPAYVESAKKVLADAWGVKDRQTLLAALKWIEDGGHRKEYESLAKTVAGYSPDKLAKAVKKAGAK